MSTAFKTLALRFWCASPSQWLKLRKGSTLKHPAQKSESPAATGQIANQSTDTADFATNPRQRKAESTLLATLALAGHAVHVGRCNDYTVCKYGYSYYAQDFDALKAFAVRLGVFHE